MNTFLLVVVAFIVPLTLELAKFPDGESCQAAVVKLEHDHPVPRHSARLICFEVDPNGRVVNTRYRDRTQADFP